MTPTRKDSYPHDTFKGWIKAAQPSNRKRILSPTCQESDADKAVQLGSVRNALLSLPLEILDLVLDNLEEPRNLRQLSHTCTRLHEIAVTHLHRSLTLSIDSHGRVERLIHAMEPHLSISQRKQLRTEGKYKGQQHQFPTHVDEDEIPDCASLVRRLTVGALPTKRAHLYIARQYLEEGIKQMENVRVVEIASITRPMAEAIASMKKLQAFSMATWYTRPETLYPLGTLRNLKHLRIIGPTPSGVAVKDNAVRSLLVNSASTLRSLHIETGRTWRQGHFLPDPNEVASGESPVYLSALESLSLIGISFSQRFIVSLERAIDFMSLSELIIGPVALCSELLFQLLTRLATAPGTAIALRKLSLSMSSDYGSQWAPYRPAADQHFQDKIHFISSFNCLSHLELNEHRMGPQRRACDPLITDTLLQAIINHANLTNLSLYCVGKVDSDHVPRLSPSIVALLINNLPKLEHLGFAPVEEEIEDIGHALSHGRALRSVLCSPQSKQLRTRSRSPKSGPKVLTGILEAFLSRDYGNTETQFTWEDHYKLNHTSLKYRSWHISSRLESVNSGKGVKTLTCGKTDKRQIMYREILSCEEPEATPTLGSGREWMRKVAKDLD